MATEAKAKVIASILGGKICSISSCAGCFASVDLKEKNECVADTRIDEYSNKSTILYVQ